MNKQLFELLIVYISTSCQLAIRKGRSEFSCFLLSWPGIASFSNQVFLGVFTLWFSWFFCFKPKKKIIHVVLVHLAFTLSFLSLNLKQKIWC